METRIFLMRHGRVENPRGLLYGSLPGFPLSAAGKRGIRTLAEEMKDAVGAIRFLRSSPALRARETAEIASEVLGVENLAVDLRLAEWGMGTWEGKPLIEFQRRSGYYDRPLRTDGMEDLASLADRVIAAIEDARAACAGGSALLVSHREPLVAALLSLQNRPWEEIHDVDFPVASVWEIVYTDAKPVTIRKRFDHHADR
jgi:broad specificity phosphatase PhoE